MKTQMSRFHIHDDLSAPGGLAARAQGGDGLRRAAPELPRRPRRLAGGAARLRALPLGAAPRQPRRCRRSSGSRSRSPSTTAASPASPSTRARRARPASGIDEVAAARDWESSDPREAALLRYLRALLEQRGHAPMHLHEEAREAGWTRRAAARGDRLRVARVADRDGQRRGRGPGGRLGRGHSRPAGGVGFAPMTPAPAARVAVATLERPGAHCCPYLHEAVELIGKRWSGAIIVVLLEGGAMRFSEIAQAIPQLSDRLLSERMKELEARGHRRAPRPARRAGQGRVRADRDGPGARADAAAAEVLVAPLADLSRAALYAAVQCRPPAAALGCRATWTSRPRPRTSRRSPRSTESASSASGSPTSSAS